VHGWSGADDMVRQLSLQVETAMTDIPENHPAQ